MSEPSIEQIEGIFRRIAANVELPGYLALDPSFAPKVVLQWRARYLAVPAKHGVTFPRDWWQAVKERFAPRWFRRRWPVAYDRYDAEMVFPQCKRQFPADMGPPVFVVVKNGVWIDENASVT
jgi:hypothetical protein